MKKTYEKNFEEKNLRNKIRKIDEKIFTVKTKKGSDKFFLHPKQKKVFGENFFAYSFEDKKL